MNERQRKVDEEGGAERAEDRRSNALKRVSTLGVDSEESVTGFVVGSSELVLSRDVSGLASGAHHDLFER